MSLKLGFVSVIRPQFKGDSPAAARRSLEELQRLGNDHDFEIFTPQLTASAHTGGGRPLPTFAVSDATTAAAAASQLRAAELDFVLIQHTTFATGDLLAPLLNAHQRVGLWALPEAGAAVGGAERGKTETGTAEAGSSEVGRPEAGSGEAGSSEVGSPEAGAAAPEATAPGTGPLPLNSLCGVNMTLSMLNRPEVGKREPVKWYYGAADDGWFRARFLTTVTALRGLKMLASARVLQIGGTAPGFYGLQEPLTLPGVTVDTAPLKSLFEAIASVPEAQADELARRYARQEPSEVTAEQLVRAARIELALADLARAGNYDALAVRCWPELPDRFHSMACLAMGNLSNDVPASCEGDVPGALSMLTLQALSGRPAVLMDLSELDQATDTLQFWHCGNAPLEWAAGGHSRLTTHFNRDNVGVVRDMPLAPGPATGFRLLSGGRALLVSGSFGPPERASFDGVRGWLGELRWNGERVSGRQFVANVLDGRLPHHFAFGHGELTEAVRELCAWLEFEPLAPRPYSDALVVRGAP